jgi:hypothetical protein
MVHGLNVDCLLTVQAAVTIVKSVCPMALFYYTTTTILYGQYIRIIGSLLEKKAHSCGC